MHSGCTMYNELESCIAAELWGSLGHPLDGTAVSRGLTSATAKSITNIDPAKSINVKSFARKSQMTLEGEL